MVDEPAAGKRFSRDLRQIREERGVSIDDIHSKTRIARTLIESFEEGRLYSHESYNRVYLRSFVRAYADAVEIPVQRALEGLDAALDGTYEGGLAEEYAHSRPESEESDGQSSSGTGTPDEEEGLSNAPSAGGPEGRGGIVGPPRAVGEEPEDDASPVPDEPSPESKPEGAQPPSTPSEPGSTGDDDQDFSSPTSSSEERSSDEDASSDSDEPVRSEGPTDDSPSWFDEEGDEEEGGGASPTSFSQQDEPSGASADAPSADVGGGGIVGEPTPLGSSAEEEPSLDRPEKKSYSDRGRSSQSSSWFSGNRREMYLSGVGLFVVIAVGVVLGFLYFSTESSTSQEESTTPAVSDTAAASSGSVDTTTTEELERPPPANLTLGETLHLTVRATANVSNLRVRRDDDLRRPYWIQEGDANVFLFEQQAILQNELEDIELFLEGYPYPVPDDTTGGIEITRSQVEAFADTLRGPPASLSVSPDTIPVGAPAE